MTSLNSINDNSPHMNGVLDSYFVDGLVRRFDLSQLQSEIKAARAKLHGETDAAVQRYLQDYLSACKLASDIIRADLQPVKSSKPGTYIDIQELKSRLDIVEIASRYTHLTKYGKNFRGCCPLHSEKTPSFFVYPERQRWSCFGACASGGDVFSLYMKCENLDFKAAIERLAGGL